jgi:hypothetical protein
MIDIETARRLVLNFLAAHSSFGQGVNDGVSDIEGSIESQAGTLTAQDQSKVHEVIWDLIVQRVLTVESKGSYKWAFLKLTDFGKDVVREQQWSPYDPGGYLTEFTNQAPKLAKLCHMYAAEALSCYRSGCYLATAVMLGAASEGAVLNLFDRLASAMEANGKLPEVAGYQTKLGKAAGVFGKYEIFKRHFTPLRDKLPNDLTDDLDLQLDGVFNLIRYYRNSSGHPTGTPVERTAAFTSLVLFVPYCKRIEAVGDWLESHSGELST